MVIKSTWAFSSGAVTKNLPASVGDTGGVGFILGWEDPPEEGRGTHSSILPGEPHGQRAWWAIVRGLAKGQARLSN